MDRFDGEWRRRVEVRPCARTEIERCIHSHYLHKWPGVNVALFGAFIDGINVGACVFSLPPRETEKRLGGKSWELSRLWLSDDLPGNAESWFIARCVRLVGRTHPEVRFLVSYADPSAGHSGVIYRAGNWVFDGMTDDGRKTPRCDYVWQGRRYSRKGHIPHGAEGIQRVPRVSKFRYVYPMSSRKRVA